MGTKRPSLTALQTTLNAAVDGFGPIINLNGDTPFDPTLDNRQSLQSQKERVDALVSGSAFTPQMYDVVTYAALVAHARASLKSPSAFDSDAIADAFIADSGYSGLLRLYRMEREGRWNVAVRNLTREEVRVQYGEYVTHYGDGPLHEIEAAKTLLVNDRVLNGQLIAQPERPEQADAHTIAARIHTAIYAEGITVHNAGVQTESTAAAAWQAFLADPKVRISFGILEVVGAGSSWLSTGGLAASPAYYLGIRGLDEILAGIRQMYTGNPNTRAFTNLALDYVTGDESLTNKIILGADVLAGIHAAKSAAQNAITKAEAKQSAVATREVAVREEVVNASRETVESAAGGSLRETAPMMPNNAAISAEQAAIRQRVLSNIAESEAARGASRFWEWQAVFDPSRLPNRPSVLFEARLPSNLFPDIAARFHFREANQQLLNALDASPEFADAIERLLPGVRQQIMNPRTVSTIPPHGWTWHHGVEVGQLWLVTSVQHWSSKLWPILHPNNRGGMSIWGGGY